jgi:hypothetical protein
MGRQITPFNVRAIFFGCFYFLQPAILKVRFLLNQPAPAVYLLTVYVSYRAVRECDLSCCSLG